MRDVNFNIDGTKFLSTSYDKAGIKLWDTETGQVHPPPPPPSPQLPVQTPRQPLQLHIARLDPVCPGVATEVSSTSVAKVRCAS